MKIKQDTITIQPGTRSPIFTLKYFIFPTKHFYIRLDYLLDSVHFAAFFISELLKSQVKRYYNFGYRHKG